MQNTQLDRIVEKLNKEAEILKPSAWQKFWSVISAPVRYPLRIVTWPLRALFSMQIVPGAYYKKESLDDLDKKVEVYSYFITNFKLDTESLRKALESFNNNFFYEQIKYKIPRNDSCSMIFTANKNDTKALEERKLTIFFGGNGQTALSSLAGLVRLHSMGNNNITNDVLFVDWPKGAKSSQELVNSGLQAVLRAMAAGYKPENITISGFSLGGAVAAEVLKESKKYLKPNEKFNAYVNYRSFSDLGSVVAGLISNVKVINFIFKTIINGLLSLLGLNLDAGSAIESGLPVEKMKFYHTKRDKNIIGQAQIAEVVKANMGVIEGVTKGVTGKDGKDGYKGKDGYGVQTTVKEDGKEYHNDFSDYVIKKLYKVREGVSNSIQR